MEALHKKTENVMEWEMKTMTKWGNINWRLYSRTHWSQVPRRKKNLRMYECIQLTSKNWKLLHIENLIELHLKYAFEKIALPKEWSALSIGGLE